MVKVNWRGAAGRLDRERAVRPREGRFTGALSRRIGRFETADRGTLFLDEIGDPPLDMQAKLLRVLQEGEFERVGGAETIRVNVRVIAATNRNPRTRWPAAGSVPTSSIGSTFSRSTCLRSAEPPRGHPAPGRPLRAQGQQEARQASSPRCSADVLELLFAYAWPGNVRELENVIERAVIISPGPELRLGSLVRAGALRQKRRRASLTRLEEKEREHIVPRSRPHRLARQRRSRRRGDSRLKPTTLESRHEEARSRAPK